ncbi:MAG: N-formylglutamate deformylase [Wenzhouxiangella sp.]
MTEAVGPVLVSVPHAGTRVSEGSGREPAGWEALADTDWYVDRLVGFAPELGAGLIIADYSRYVVDLNRPADDRPLYDQAGTGLVPTETFGGDALYVAGQQPDAQDRADRVERYWRPYHDALTSQLEAIRQRYGFAVLLDAHSIASQVPRLFDGRLPDLNLGTFGGRSCADELQHEVTALLDETDAFSHVVNGRFKGGYITRHYGRPEVGVHALQLEIAQACYMNELTGQWDDAQARPLKSFLRQLLERLLAWRPS